MEPKVHVFEKHRPLLEGLAYRMLGVRADARDVVQETFLRWSAAEDIDDPRAWLVTVCSRIALNALQSARARREVYVGTWLPEPFDGPNGEDPLDRLQVDHTISMALMHALERLTPPERASLLLHDVYGYTFDEIATMLRRPSTACRKLASRARDRVREAKPRFTASADEHRRLLAAFLVSVRAGDREQLQTLLTAEAELHADGGGKAKTIRRVLRGPKAITKFYVALWRALDVVEGRLYVESCWLNGAPGLLMYEKGELAAAVSMSIAGGKIHRIYAHRNPEKLNGIPRGVVC